MLEVGKREDVIFLVSKLTVEPRESGSGDAGKVDVVGPELRIVARGCHVLVGHLLQGLLDTCVAHLHYRGQETVTVFVPRGVGLEPCHLLRHHLDAGRGAVEHALAQLQLRGLDGVDVVVAVGDEVEHVDVGQILGVGEAGVLESHLEAGIAVAIGTRTLQVGEIDHTQLLIALEGILTDGIELEVVVHTDVVAQFQCALVLR